MERISFSQVTITDGFWKRRQQINAKTTVYAVYDRFLETGRFAALHCDWREGEPNRPDCFWDSDVAKWIEAAAYLLEQERDDFLEQAIDNIVASIEKNQRPGGYYNSYFNAVEPSKRFCERICLIQRKIRRGYPESEGSAPKCRWVCRTVSSLQGGMGGTGSYLYSLLCVCQPRRQRDAGMGWNKVMEAIKKDARSAHLFLVVSIRLTFGVGHRKAAVYGVHGPTSTPV